MLRHPKEMSSDGPSRYHFVTDTTHKYTDLTEAYSANAAQIFKCYIHAFLLNPSVLHFD
jgi:hypothetical protein